MDVLTQFLGLSGIWQTGSFPLLPLKLPISVLGSLDQTAPISLLNAVQTRTPELIDIQPFISQSLSCGSTVSSLHLSSVELQQINLGSNTGYVSIVYQTTGNRPFRLSVDWNGSTVIDTLWRGPVSANSLLLSLCSASITGPSSGIISFYKNYSAPSATVTVYDPFDNFAWSYYINCPQATPLQQNIPGTAWMTPPMIITYTWDGPAGPYDIFTGTTFLSSTLGWWSSGFTAPYMVWTDVSSLLYETFSVRVDDAHTDSMWTLSTTINLVADWYINTGTGGAVTVTYNGDTQSKDIYPGTVGSAIPPTTPVGSITVNDDGTFVLN
jgi:hypothetical protein